MTSADADVNKICKKCRNQVNVHLTCFECDATYHIYCLKKVPGVYVNQRGHLFCCRNITSKRKSTRKSSRTQHELSEKLRAKGSLDACNKDLENNFLGEKDADTNKFKCDASPSEFAIKNLLENHCQKSPNEQHEKKVIQELKGDEDLDNNVQREEGLERNVFKYDTYSLELTNKEHQENHNKRNFQKESYDPHIKQCEKYNSQLNTLISKKAPQVHILPNYSNTEKSFKCSKCQYSSYAKASLVRHMHTHTNARRFKCDECDFAATWKTSLNYHVLAKHSNTEKKYKCDDCNFFAHAKGNLLEHVRIHTNEKPFKCDMCDYAASRKASLKIHSLAKHSNSEKCYKCKECKYSSHTKPNLINHMRTHTNERRFKCENCDYAAVKRAHLNAHIIAKHSNADEHSSPEKIHKCSDCEYSTHVKARLVKHMLTHTKERPFKCDMCNYTTNLKWSLKGHFYAKHSNAEKKYKCKECKYSSYVKTSLVRHTRTHTKEKPFKCDLCDYAAALKAYLKTHIHAKHSNAEKKYKCDECKYSSHEKSSLLKHIPIHDNERPMKCDICDYSSVQKSTLKLHILSKHSNAEKRYKCGDCKYSSHVQANLVRHMHIHTD